MRYSISVLCFNHVDLTRRCLKSIRKHSPPQDVEILVTDNGSTDGTRDHVMRLIGKDPRVKFFGTPNNEGVIAPKNRALARARGRFFVSVDNDCTVTGGWLRELEAPFVDERVIQVGRTGAYQQLDANGVGIRGGRLDYVDGSLFMVRADMARELVLCDPAFDFCYCEDADFSLRARKAGWKLATVPLAVKHVEHATAHGGGLGRDLREVWRRNHRLFKQRWAGFLKDHRFGHPGEPEPAEVEWTSDEDAPARMLQRRSREGVL